MLRFMNAITDKENWHVKILDEAIAEKWKTEAIEAARAEFIRARDDPSVSHRGKQDDASNAESTNEAEGTNNNNQLDDYPFYTVPRDESSFTTAMADYCIDELRHTAPNFHTSPNGSIIVYNGNVVKSDSAVPPEIRRRCKRPLFPLVYGKTKVLPVGAKVTSLEAGDAVKRCGQGDVLPTLSAPSEKCDTGYFSSGTTNPYSSKFQWLPCDVDISSDRAKILSYINNLHPDKHKDLYHVIEDVITASIPLWNITLAPLADANFTHRKRIPHLTVEFDPNPREIPDDEEWIEKYTRTILPDIEEPFNEGHVQTPAPFSLKERMQHERPLQVIVKLANIELTPDKPHYPGGTWHVEGQLNEHIVATALYYYSSSNITPSSLAFRQVSELDEAAVLSHLEYPQGVVHWLKEVYGCEDREGAVQYVGAVETREGRLLTFPNILQHQVQPFSLNDKTKPGHRKILALFLVDPHIRVISTAHVPAQRMDWWREEFETPPMNLKGINTVGLEKLPLELQDHVLDGVDFPISLAEAKQLRGELMEERKNFVLDHGRAFEGSICFSLCEH
ncbi:hypothetical protein CC1G_14939 [Coprinopsis cinerea okayama7|uniref:Uncharacterized protein n=1 Tax=Coprinopsis cinerea (strain Okayama-7 / 130 / ATCC MYA-4618 / FGSC 9003) TaxID=240176 RepID=D6RP02_COPC7|nr:hypothetical protein CC1G_14939 [Coprinopsis cinerea okayama7\|eukprot:XP_002910608.1 hypothetical protein CC1G_14939 [Coprinopsis cinerea okayama7\